MVCLNISDDYGFMDRELQEILMDCVYEHICRFRGDIIEETGIDNR